VLVQERILVTNQPWVVTQNVLKVELGFLNTRLPLNPLYQCVTFH